MSVPVIQAPSPNFNERNPAVRLDYIVLHYTGMRSADEALRRMSDPVAKVSAHYMIEEDGRIFHLVDEKDRAWHAGKSLWRGETDINSASIGIELVNPGHEFGYRPFPARQIETLQSLLGDITARQKINPRTGLLAHSDVAPARKTDPGELFPWREMAQAGFGFWPAPQMGAAENVLQQIGYDMTDSAATWAAFQRRYLPHSITGKPDAASMEMAAGLLNLLQQEHA